MPYYHGILVSEQATTVPTPLVAPSGISFVVGTAPVQSVTDGKINVPVLANTFEEAVAALGYSDDWSTYTLCEFMDSHFKLFGMSPVIFLNVLDPAAVAMKEAVAAADKTVTDKQIKLSIDAIDSTVVVKAAGGAGDPYALDTDYELFYEGEYLVIEVLSGGSIYAAASLNVAYSQIKISGVTTTEIIGGYNTDTHVYSGLECIKQVLALFGVAPDLICAPGWSHNATVAAAMSAKADGIFDLFKAKAICDVLTTSAGADYYTEVAALKASNGITSANQILCWPMAKAGSKAYHLSTLVAGILAQTDTVNGCPYESPSNKALPIDSIVTDDGDGTYSEVILTLDEANTLNAAGVMTALRWLTGFTLWGNYTAAYPTATDIKDTDIGVSRMGGWLAASVIYTHWAKLDKPMSRLLIDSIKDGVDIWMNGLKGSGYLLGGRIEFKPEDNPLADLLAGKAKYRIFYASGPATQELEFTLAYDVSYLTSAMS